MKIRFLSSVAILMAFLSLAQADVDAQKDRDPFWPVGYRTEGTLTQEVVVVVEPEVEVKATDQKDWEEARAKLPRPGGIFIGAHLGSRKMVDKMILGGKTYYVGDQVCLTNEFVAFTWRIDTISFKSTNYELSPVSAVRVLKEVK